MTDILVFGSLNIDLVIRTQRFPLPGETIHGEDLQTIPGGKGANQAAAAAKLGSRVAMVGRVGQDAFGPTLVENLSQLGVNTRGIFLDEQAATGTALIILDAQGENRIVLSPGANGRIDDRDIERCLPLLSTARLLLLQLEVPLPAVGQIAHLAHQSGLQVLLNPAPGRELPQELFADIDYLVPNETELSLLSGEEVQDIPSTIRAARKLIAAGVKTVLVTLGARGALFVSADLEQHIPTRKVDVVDTTAAGDAFIGGFATALIDGLSPVEAAAYACAAGTLAVTKFGAQPSLPSRAEVDAFFQQAMSS